MRRINYWYLTPLIPMLLVLFLVVRNCMGSLEDIYWADFIKFDDITYLRSYQSSSFPAANLTAYDKIQFTVSHSVKNSGYKSKNGDSAYLGTGTPVYSILGYSPQFRLLAMSSERQIIYEADTNPNARKGEDLLDIEGKVTTIGINSGYDGTTELGSIKDEIQVASLVRMILAAPVDQSVQGRGGERYFLDFNLSDGTHVKRAYLPDTGELSRGILLPPEFGQAVKSALN